MHLITGGSGYFGEILAKKLLKKKQKVRILDLNEPSRFLLGNVDFVKGDIRDGEKVYESLKDINYVYNNVAQVPLVKNKNLFESVNYFGTKILLEKALELNVKKIIHISSSAIYGIPKSNPVNENTLPTPLEPYGKAKYEAEKLCKQFIDLGLNITIIRPRTILGHGRLGIFSILFEWVKDGYNVPVLNDGKNIYQFVHAEDLAEICWLSSKKNRPDTYNVGATNFCTMRDTLEGLCEHAGTGSIVKSLPMFYVEKAMNLGSLLGISPLGKYHSLMFGRSLYFDNIKVQKQLHYKTKYSNIEAINETYDWYIKNLNSVKSISKFSPHQKKINKKIIGMLKYLI